MKQVMIGCFLNVLIFFGAFSRDIYVSPKGNNQFPGTREKPIQSILLAKQMAYQYLQSNKDEKLTVWLSDGIYSITEPMVFVPFESTLDNASLLFKALPGAEPIISGGLQISNWSKRQDGLWECYS